MKLRTTQWIASGIASGSLMVALAAPPAMAQHDRGRSNQGNNRGNGNYYNGMRDNERGGNYDQRYRDDERNHQHHDNGGGIGPGYGALIGGGGGAALGAVFGGGMKGTLIGGAAGAGLGALGGKLAQGSGNNRDHNHHR